MFGIRAMCYLGEKAIQGEAELRGNLPPRWSLLGFGGIGHAVNDDPTFDTRETVSSGGAGFRYLISLQFGIHTGADVAQGSEETAFDIAFGSAWVR